MQYFTEQGASHAEALERVRSKYGERAKVLQYRSVRMGGFLGLFAREGVELTGYVPQEPRKKQALNIEEEKQKILKTVRDDQTLQTLLKEVKSIKQSIADGRRPEDDEHPTVSKIERLMVDNDFSYSFIRKTIDRMKRELSLEELDDFNAVQSAVVDWIGEHVQLHRETFDTKPKVLVLVGPTGVGKTTTIAKLAAVHGLGTSGTRPRSVRMITIDNYRIGAKQQIETYGDIMGIPVNCVETTEELKKRIALYEDVDMVLVDTIGKSPKDYMKLAEMREMLDACGSSAEVFLALSATTKSADLREILQQFEPFKYRAVVLTKIDETMHIGNMISALSEHGKPIAYVTDGQVVPQDIERATVARILMHLDGFRVNQERISELFDRSDSTVR